jgi:hypothetical protein
VQIHRMNLDFTKRMDLANSQPWVLLHFLLRKSGRKVRISSLISQKALTRFDFYNLRYTPSSSI